MMRRISKLAPDALLAAGVGCIGVGIWQFSAAVAWLFAGAVAVLAAVELSSRKGRDGADNLID
jgi:hypothetical protein